jgi:hypothetical protein
VKSSCPGARRSSSGRLSEMAASIDWCVPVALDLAGRDPAKTGPAPSDQPHAQTTLSRCAAISECTRVRPVTPIQ